MAEVRLAGVRVDLRSDTPVVLLQETSAPGRTLPIFIGTAEATAIAYAVEGVVPERPLTHDLMRDMLAALGAEVDSVVVTEIRRRNENDGMFLAEVHLRLQGKEVIVSSRPSDAVALAVRVDATLFVADDLMEAEGLLLRAEGPEDEPANPEDLVKQFQHFIEEVRPEDFSR
ncbi:MAG: bifunctional nuclease family protein [Acidimicrobiales bacterium]